MYLLMPLHGIQIVSSEVTQRAHFNVWTCLMWLSNPLFETLTWSHWGHLYLYVTFPSSPFDLNCDGGFGSPLADWPDANATGAGTFFTLNHLHQLLFHLGLCLYCWCPGRGGRQAGSETSKMLWQLAHPQLPHCLLEHDPPICHHLVTFTNQLMPFGDGPYSYNTK